MDEETLRQMAITQYLQGKKPISVYRDLGKPKKWFFKWLKRYRSGDEHWYRDLSRTPLSQPNQTSSDTRKLIVSIRNDLDSSYTQIGVTTIRWEGQKLGIALPSDNTINRILKREDLVKKNPYRPKGVEYPYFQELLGIHNIHQGDLVGPGYIKNDGRFYSWHIIDRGSHRVFIHPQRRKNDLSVASALIRCWKTMGVPDFLQLDNELSFHGSHRHPRSLRVVLRLCLLMRVEVVFIPVGEPWRNAVVESFNEPKTDDFSVSNGFTTPGSVQKLSDFPQPEPSLWLSPRLNPFRVS